MHKTNTVERAIIALAILNRGEKVSFYDYLW
jgi:hypothetical protein